MEEQNASCYARREEEACLYKGGHLAATAAPPAAAAAAQKCPFFTTSSITSGPFPWPTGTNLPLATSKTICCVMAADVGCGIASMRPALGL